MNTVELVHDFDATRKYSLFVRKKKRHKHTVERNDVSQFVVSRKKHTHTQIYSHSLKGISGGVVGNQQFIKWKLCVCVALSHVYTCMKHEQ